MINAVEWFTEPLHCLQFAATAFRFHKGGGIDGGLGEGEGMLSSCLVVVRWLAELGCAGSVPGPGRKQCWEGKHPSQAPSSARDVRPCTVCRDFGER